MARRSRPATRHSLTLLPPHDAERPTASRTWQTGGGEEARTPTVTPPIFHPMTLL